jgi:two-component system, chemotaxis family, sensor kinase Cph1
MSAGEAVTRATGMANATPVDLTNCDREPIHVPGAIQPHGALLVLDARELRITHASENCRALLGVAAAELLGTDPAAVLGESTVAALSEAIAADAAGAVGPVPVRAGGEPRWIATAHRCNAGVAVELEPAAAGDPRSVAALFGRVRQALTRLQATRTLPTLFDAMAQEIRRLTGFERVMVYRFDAQWSGEVVAEDRADGIEGFLGLRFPASDIPAQARALYRRNWLRIIVDAAYVPSPIVPPTAADGAPIDLSAASLRSVSPVHLEYLRNMGVGASMSVSLLRDGALWGLVACHDRAPRYLPYEVRAACEFLGQTFSVQLGTLADEAERDYALTLAALRGELLNRTARGDAWPEALVDGEPGLAAIAGAGGAAVWRDGRAYRTGAAPDDAQIAALVRWLDEGGADRYETDALAAAFPPAAAYAAVASGLLALAIGGTRGDYLLWFRPEAVRTVTWAGNPHKPVHAANQPAASAAANAAGDTAAPGDSGAGTADGSPPEPAVPGRLHPRRSFAAWSETVRGQALPWRAAERNAALAIRDHIVEIVLRQAEELERLNAELRRSNEELEAFGYIVSHDLKEPLRGIHAYADMLMADHHDALDEDGRGRIETMKRLSVRMDGMLDSLLRYARAGLMELDLVPTDMQRLLEEVLDNLDARVRAADAEIVVSRPLPTTPCDPIRAGAVFQNLIANAIKYNDSPRPRVEIGWDRRDAVHVFHVRDNGIGIPADQHKEIFRIFRRLHGRTQYGGGSGAGLTIARRLVERHGGRIWLESHAGQSTTFYFTLEPS